MTDEKQSGGPVFIDAAKIFKTIELEYPFFLNGVTYREIRLTRLTAAEVVAFQESIKALPPDASVDWPIYRDAEGAPLPAGVLDALMDDDRLEVDKATRDFLPRRFRGDPASASTPANGGDTGSS